MATDWGEEKPELTRKLLARIFKYFLPYWPRGLAALACIGLCRSLTLATGTVTGPRSASQAAASSS